ncbi:MAG: response regulator [Deltaproteobacteria bacterium]|nr:response regulator [Deltaproteobacteria bacterium]
MQAPKVLVVEDDIHTRRIVEQVLVRDQMLRYLNIEVIGAADGQEGLDLFRKHHPDLLITDLIMPRMSGFDLVNNVRRLPEGAKVPILVTSAVVRDQKTLRRLELDHHVAVMLKPFSPRQLGQLVRQLLSRRAEAGEMRRGPAAPEPRPSRLETPAAGPTPTPSRLTLPDRVTGVQDGRQGAEAGPSPLTTMAQAMAGASVAPTTRAAAPALVETPERSPDRAGSLSQTSLAQLLLEALENLHSGTLELKHGSVRKVIYLMVGHPIFVQSNVRAETLGQLLVRRGGLTLDQYQQALTESQRRQIKYGEALVRLGFLSEQDVMAELVAQTQYKIEVCLRWREGSWAFVADAQVGSQVPNCTLDPVWLVFEGLKRNPSLEAATGQLIHQAAHGVALLPRFEHFRGIYQSVYGDAVISRMGPGVAIGALMHAVDFRDAVLQLDVLLQCGLAELRDPVAVAAAVPVAVSVEDVPLDVLVAPSSAASSAALISSGTIKPLTGSFAALATPPREAVRPGAVAAAADARYEDSGLLVLPDLPPSTAEAVLPQAPVEPPPARSPSSAKRRPRRVETAELDLARQVIESTYLGVHDATHYQVLGVIPDTAPDGIEVAYQIKRKQFDLGRYRREELGEDAYGRLEEIRGRLDEAFAILSDPQERAAYDLQLKGGVDHSQRNAALQGEERYRKGEVLLEAGRFSEAAEAFERAVALDPQPEYEVFAALARFMSVEPSPEAAEEAMIRVQAALESQPELTAAHLVAARISEIVGNPEEAVGHLQTAIGVDPTMQEAFDEAERLLLSLDRLPDLEQQYRRTLHVLGGQDPEWAGKLWKRLVQLYLERLGDREKARLAAEAALRLDPEDRVLRTSIAAMNAVDPDRWPEAVLGYRALLRTDPQHVEPLHELFLLHLRADRTDAAFVTAAVAVQRQVASDEERQFVAARRGQRPVLHSGRLTPEVEELFRHPEEEPALTLLFRQLGPLIHRLHPLRPETLGLEGTPLPEAGQPELFRRILGDLASQLGVTRPTVMLQSPLGGNREGVGLDPPLLLVGAAALYGDDETELRFRLGRTLWLLSPGRVVAAWRSKGQLKTYVLAGLAASYPKLEVPDPSGEVAEVRRELEGRGELRQAIKKVLSGLQARTERLNLGVWLRGTQRTADRVGWLACGDVGLAMRIAGSLEPEAEADLADFALSQTGWELRARLKLALS